MAAPPSARAMPRYTSLRSCSKLGSVPHSCLSCLSTDSTSSFENIWCRPPYTAYPDIGVVDPRTVGLPNTSNLDPTVPYFAAPATHVARWFYHVALWQC